MGERERQSTRKKKKELDDILTTNNYREHKCATADLLWIAMIVVLSLSFCERRIYSNFTAELYTYIKWCLSTYLRNKKKMPVVQPTSINSPWNKKCKYLKWSKKNNDDGICVSEKKNILLHIYLFSSEMKRREREKESNIISLLSLSLSGSLFH